MVYAPFDILLGTEPDLFSPGVSAELNLCLTKSFVIYWDL